MFDLELEEFGYICRGSVVGAFYIDGSIGLAYYCEFDGYGFCYFQLFWVVVVIMFVAFLTGCSHTADIAGFFAFLVRFIPWCFGVVDIVGFHI